MHFAQLPVIRPPDSSEPPQTPQSLTITLVAGLRTDKRDACVWPPALQYFVTNLFTYSSLSPHQVRLVYGLTGNRY
jgi:hypothetical protein